MKVSELVNKIEKKGFDVFEIKMETFLATVDMYAILDDLKERAIIVRDNGMFEIDVLLRDTTINLGLLDLLTDIEFDDEFTFEQYDLLRKHNVFKAIYINCESEGNSLEYFFKLCTETLAQEVKLRNSIEGLVANGIMNLVNKIPDQDQMAKYIKDFKGFNPETVQTISSLFEFATKKGDASE